MADKSPKEVMLNKLAGIADIAGYLARTGGKNKFVSTLAKGVGEADPLVQELLSVGGKSAPLMDKAIKEEAMGALRAKPVQNRLENVLDTAPSEFKAPALLGAGVGGIAGGAQDTDKTTTNMMGIKTTEPGTTREFLGNVAKGALTGAAITSGARALRTPASALSKLHGGGKIADEELMRLMDELGGSERKGILNKVLETHRPNFSADIGKFQANKELKGKLDTMIGDPLNPDVTGGGIGTFLEGLKSKFAPLIGETNTPLQRYGRYIDAIKHRTPDLAQELGLPATTAGMGNADVFRAMRKFKEMAPEKMSFEDAEGIRKVMGLEDIAAGERGGYLRRAADTAHGALTGILPEPLHQRILRKAVESGMSPEEVADLFENYPGPQLSRTLGR
jgi:hypothetical protein